MIGSAIILVKAIKKLPHEVKKIYIFAHFMFDLKYMQSSDAKPLSAF